MRSGESGYSMVEVLVSILLLSVAIIPMTTMLDSGLKAATTSSDYDRARTLANSNLEEIKSRNFASVESMGSACPVAAPPGFTCSLTTTYQKLTFSGNSATFANAGASDAKNMLKVVVVISWKSSSFTETGLVTR